MKEFFRAKSASDRFCRILIFKYFSIMLSRCRFELEKMIEDENLELVGATWYEGIGDAAFLAKARLGLGAPEEVSSDRTH